MNARKLVQEAVAAPEELLGLKAGERPAQAGPNDVVAHVYHDGDCSGAVMMVNGAETSHVESGESVEKFWEDMKAVAKAAGATHFYDEESDPPYFSVDAPFPT